LLYEVRKSITRRMNFGIRKWKRKKEQKRRQVKSDP
jgi:hypothetical protein